MMRKITCFVLALLLCLSATALAESPSRMTSDMTNVEVSAENLPAGTGFTIHIVVKEDKIHQTHIDACNAEVAKLTASNDVEKYFGTVTDNKGNTVSPKKVLGADKLNVYEFDPLIASGYKEAYGTVTAKILLSTPYEKGEKVVVMLGQVTKDAAGNQNVKWTAYEGTGLGVQNGAVEKMGAIEVKLDPAIVMAMQEDIVLMAVVSK